MGDFFWWVIGWVMGLGEVKSGMGWLWKKEKMAREDDG